MELSPEMMVLVAQRGLSEHPSVVSTRDQIHAYFLDFLERVGIERPRELTDRDRYLIAAAMDYALQVAEILDRADAPVGKSHVAIVIAALLVEAGYAVVLDDDDGSDKPRIRRP